MKQSLTKKEIGRRIEKIQTQVRMFRVVSKEEVIKELQECTSLLLLNGYAHKEVLALQMEIWMKLGEMERARELQSRFKRTPMIQGEKSFLTIYGFDASQWEIYWHLWSREGMLPDRIAENVNLEELDPKIFSLGLSRFRDYCDLIQFQTLQKKAQAVVARRRDFFSLAFHLEEMRRMGEYQRADRLLARYLLEGIQSFQKGNLDSWWFLVAVRSYFLEVRDGKKARWSSILTYLSKRDFSETLFTRILEEASYHIDARNQNSWYSKKLKDTISNSQTSKN
ncbi:hypothetical protein [Risungbinella massiliensis]|uniref:hypothetical protein n=1 Tax=Risungbinella massiliensis TaxID=1329796 RepID=UPI0005CC2B09|nr:hypothetical protein [Risungbinella massiliensis]